MKINGPDESSILLTFQSQAGASFRRGHQQQLDLVDDVSLSQGDELRFKSLRREKYLHLILDNFLNGIVKIPNIS